jgi:hypothetical protein
MDVRELARAQMVLAVLVNAQGPHDWALHVADQVIPVQPVFPEGAEVRFIGHILFTEPWGGSVGLAMDGDLVWAFPEMYFPPGECDVAFALGTRLDPVE